MCSIGKNRVWKDSHLAGRAGHLRPQVLQGAQHQPDHVLQVAEHQLKSREGSVWAKDLEKYRPTNCPRLKIAKLAKISPI
jgi:hypothetical protein